MASPPWPIGGLLIVVIALLRSEVMPYAWGSRTAIAELRGETVPSATPEAELWMGAHPQLPSHLGDQSLAEVIAADPRRTLGAAVVARFGARLPFLLKVLAAAQPLSLQAHPNAEQARLGFEAEERLGIPRDAANRNYRDPSHKPELLSALTPVEALCGFRDERESRALFARLGAEDLTSGGVRDAFGRIVALDAERVARIVAACAETDDPSCRWATKLAAMYPGDPGAVTSLLLNLVRVEPGEALYLEAGNLHAYLDGVGVEIMASSDNVLRGGLTKKHVDVPELLRILDFRDGPVTPLRPRAVSETERVYDTGAADFRLSIVSGDAELVADGPEILLCTEGKMSAGDIAIPRGEAAFVAAETGHYRIHGAGRVYRATVNA